ncbi:hypothetical protein ACTTAI_05795 [Rhodobacter capsulatus]|uniref:hypothetical protein n=1 Tax=Rhodobacter capsulatus TaxID=1061 RepID=UPI004025FF9C
MKHWIKAAAAVVMLSTGAAMAGPVSDFEAVLRGAYAPYRTALFATNMNAPDKALAALEAFHDGWGKVIDTASGAPQYADDKGLVQTLAAVSAKAEIAGAAVRAGQMAQAHEALEGIRDDIGALHERNGMIGFSDRMNAYHAAMEAVLAVPSEALDAVGMEGMREQAGVLAYLAADIAAHPAPEAAAPEYAPLHAAFQASVAGFVEAVRSGDPGAVTKAIGALKAPYSKFFVAFG